MSTIIDILINYGLLGIVIAGFSEAIFLPMPMEFVFFPISLVNPSRAFFYSIVLILFSILGSLTGYIIGSFVGVPILNKMISKDTFNKLKLIYSKNSFLAILTSSFTPIPYEVYVLSAGTFKIGFVKFIAASIISRIIRYFPQGIVISLYGERFLPYIKNYIAVLSLLIFTAILLLRYYKKRLNKGNKLGGSTHG